MRHAKLHGARGEEGTGTSNLKIRLKTFATIKSIKINKIIKRGI